MKKKIKKIAVIVSDFNDYITAHMLDSCIRKLNGNGIKKNNIAVFHVPGAYEIAPVLSKALKSRKFSAYICIGCIIKGNTPHYKHISDHANNAVSRLAIKYEAVVANAILTCSNIREAIERSGCKMGNKGADAALAVLETLKVIDTIK